jgi:hypothetical protein
MRVPNNMLDQLNTAFEALTNGPIWIVLVVAAVALSQVLRWACWFPNKAIPWTVVALPTVGYPLLGNVHAFPTTQRNPLVFMTLIGMILGAVSWGFHAILLTILFKKLQALLPEGWLPKDVIDCEPKEKDSK